MRLIIRILEFCQRDLNGIKYKDCLRQLEYQNDDVLLKMPVRDVYFSDFSLEIIRKDLEGLRSKSIEFYDYENKVWSACGIIEKPHVFGRTGMMEFKIDLKFWKELRNIAHGIRRCELNKVLILPTVYAMWFYMFISEKDTPINITIDNLKERLGISKDDYKRSNGKDRIDHLEERVIKPSQKALNDSCPYTFKYEKIRENPDNKRSPVKSLRITPVFQPQFRDKNLEKKVLIAKTSVSMINPQVYEYMTKTMGFMLSELQANKETLDNAVKYIPDILDKLNSLQGRRRQADGTIKEKGWIIAALKSEIDNAKKKQSSPKTISIDTGYVASLFDANK